MEQQKRYHVHENTAGEVYFCNKNIDAPEGSGWVYLQKQMNNETRLSMKNKGFQVLIRT